MTSYTILRRIALGPQHQATGKTRHYSGSNELPSAASLRIAQYQDDDGYYLLYFDPDGNELTDTYHDSIEGAMAQAQWEYQVKAEEWKSSEN